MSDEKESPPSAFPNGNLFKDNRGLTIRDYFAAKAMDALIAKDKSNLEEPGNLAAKAYKYADAMMAAREKK